MKIDKSKLSKALKQIGIFVGKGSINQNASLVHFRNENNKAVLFATDFASAGRATFETEEQGLFEFCIEYAQLLQSTKIRSKEIDAELFENRECENGVKCNGIQFSDDKTKFVWATRGADDLAEIEAKTVVPNCNFVEIDAKTLKYALKEAGYARNEKNNQTPYIMGVNFSCENKDISLVSTDKCRIAAWKEIEKPENGFDGRPDESVSGIFSPKTIQSVMLFDDDDHIKVYIDDTQIALISENFEAYATKIQSDYPNISSFFQKEIISSYEVSVADVKESLGIIVDSNVKSLKLSFTEDKVHFVANLQTGESMEDEIVCIRKSGKDETISFDPNYFGQIFSNVDSDKMTIEFRNMGGKFNIVSYRGDDGAYGMLAPQKNVN